MHLSENGNRLIKSFEGYHTRQPDGSCKAYRCPAGVWTCGWGATDGVGPHTHWTEAEAEERLVKELEKFEKAVLQHVRVPLNQNQFDALVSFAYNCGEGALQRSKLLKKINAGDNGGAAREFHRWSRGGGRVLNGLVARRARESALFMKPVEAPLEPIMPQAVSASIEKPSRPAVAVATGAAVAAAPALSPALPPLPVPDVPAVVTESVKNIEAWTGMGDQLWQIWVYAAKSPLLCLALGISVLAVWLGPRLIAGRS